MTRMGLAEVLMFGLALAFLTELLRALVPWPKDWLNRKPLSCNVCMAGWGAICAGFFWRFPVLPTIAAAGFALLVLEVYRWLRTAANLASPPM